MTYAGVRWRDGSRWRVQVAMKVESGVGQLVKAEKTQRQSRLILCIMFLVVAVIIMLLVVVFKKLFL